MEIILVRHGETEWNVNEVFRGRINIGLSARGARQAGLLGQYLSGTKIEAIYSSPLWRAFQTAEAIDKYHHLGIKVADELIDFDFGEWQGLSLPEVREKHPELFQEWAEHPEKVKIPGGESLEDVSERASSFIIEAMTRHAGNVIMVSHRVVNKVIICALLGLDNSHFWNIRQDVCGVTSFAYENERFVLTQHNDTSFLKSEHEAVPVDF